MVCFFGLFFVCFLFVFGCFWLFLVVFGFFLTSFSVQKFVFLSFCFFLNAPVGCCLFLFFRNCSKESLFVCRFRSEITHTKAKTKAKQKQNKSKTKAKQKQ